MVGVFLGTGDDALGTGAGSWPSTGMSIRRGVASGGATRPGIAMLKEAERRLGFRGGGKEAAAEAEAEAKGVVIVREDLLCGQQNCPSEDKRDLEPRDGMEGTK